MGPLDLLCSTFVDILFHFACRSSFCLISDRAIYDLHCIALDRLIIIDEFITLHKILRPRYAPHPKKTDRNGRICRACHVRRGREGKSKGQECNIGIQRTADTKNKGRIEKEPVNNNRGE